MNLVQKNKVKGIIDDYKTKGINMALEQIMKGSIKLPMNSEKKN